MDQLIQIVQGNAPMIVIVGLGFWRVLVALHKIELRLVRVETKIHVPVEQRTALEVPP